MAIHDTTLGPALGGTRMWPYASEGEALRDVLRLSRGMTYKAAAAGLKLGGGKAVIIGDPKKIKSEALFHSYGRFINTLNGRYITAEDSGTDVRDMEQVHQETEHVVGIERSHGGSGNPAPYTALGVFSSIQATLGQAYGDENLKGKIVVVQGVGQVGTYLIEHLNKAGAKVFAADIDHDRLAAKQKQLGFEIVSEESVFATPCDVFAPCALGAVLNRWTLPNLRCKMVVGASNNQLETPEDADRLKKRGILYAPDYVVNAGGLINVYLELEGYSAEKAEKMTLGIYNNVKKVFAIAERDNISTSRAADRMVEEILEPLKKSSNRFQEKRAPSGRAREQQNHIH